MRPLLLFAIMLFVLSGANAQDNDRQRAVDIFRNTLARYHSNAGLRCVLTYKYSPEQSPHQYSDSLRGEIEMYGDNYHFRLDSTEVVGNTNLTAILFHEDRTIYLARTPDLSQSKNPLALLDSVLLKNKSLTCKVRDTADCQSITLTFGPGSPAKSIEYLIDKRSGYVSKMLYLVPAKALYDPSVQSLVEIDDKFVIVETDMSQYQEGITTADQLDVHHYYKKEGSKFVALPPYSSYTIIAGTPEL